MSTISYQVLSDEAIKLANLLAPSTYIDALALTAAGLTYATFALRKYTWDRPDPLDYIFFEKPQGGDGASCGANQKTRNIAQRLEELDKNAVVFWGSQSGTAEGFANRLGRELHQRFHLRALVADPSDFDPGSIAEIPKEKICLFLLSTYGEGDPSDNASQLWDWVTKLKEKPLSSVRFATFGLGNSNYRYYNRVAEVVDQALQGCGATRLQPLGMADDAKGATEEDFTSWKDDLFRLLREDLHLEEHEVTYEPSLTVTEDDSLQPTDLHLSEPIDAADGSKKASANSPIKPIRIRNAHELFASGDRSGLHLELDLTETTQLSYKTGDHLGIWPMNPDQEVERLLSVLGLSDKRHMPICIKALDPAVRVKVPTPTTFDALARHFLEICATVPRDIVAALAEFAPSPAAKAFLLSLGRDKKAYAQFLAVTHVNLGRLLELAIRDDHGETPLTWSTIPLSFLVENIPRTQPRYYSISSSSIISPRSPSITVGVADMRLLGDAEASVPGLTTNYIQSTVQSLPDFKSSQPANGYTYNVSEKREALERGTVFAHIRRSKFKLPALASCPLLMVAAGTGIAPFRAFVDERLRLQSIGKPIGSMILFFGCQHPDRDYLYKSELEEIQRVLGDKLRIVTAFSRVEGSPRVYVQDRIGELGSEVCGMLSDGASLYICGRASMAREVGKAVREIVGTARAWGESEMKDWSEGMRRNRKWQEDVWG